VVLARAATVVLARAATVGYGAWRGDAAFRVVENANVRDPSLARGGEGDRPIMRLLFVTSTRIGDAVLSTVLLDRLIARHPGLRVTIACGPVAAPLFEAVPGLERIMVLNKRPFSAHWLSLWASCVGRMWAIVVDLRNAPLTWLVPAGRCWRLGRVANDRHRVESLAAVLGLESDPPAPRLWATDADRAAARRLIPDGPPVLALGATANWPGKVWPADRFAELAARLTAPSGMLAGARVALFGQAEERPSVESLIDTIPPARRIDLVGKVGLLEAFACLERASLYVGNDSGLMHVAAAAGVPTLGLFGPSDERLYAPWGSACAAVRCPTPFAEIVPDDYDHGRDGSLMVGLSVDRVEEAVATLWSRVRESAA